MIGFNENALKIAIDFDGTIVENAYPAIGEEMIFAFDTMKALQKKGHKLILWTFRTGERLDEAINYCKEHDIEFYAVNENFPGEPIDNTWSRKLNVDLFIDDRNIGGFLGWSKVWQLLDPDNEEFEDMLINPEAHRNYRPKIKRQWLFRLFYRKRNV